MIEGLYIHVPFCDGKCHYCAFYSVPYSREKGAAWLAALKREAEAARSEFGPFAFSTVFLGGGTPTILPMDQLEALLGVVGRLIEMREASVVTGVSPVSTQEKKDAADTAATTIEWTSEANPGSVDGDKLRLMKSAGVNRISLGAQAFDDGVLRQLGRRHSVKDIYAAVEAIKSAGFTNWGLDLIACVPGVSLEAWRESLCAAVALDPAHVSVYALTREEGTRLDRDHQAGVIALLDDDEQLRMLDLAEEVLGAAGLPRYEISNYARPGFECRHNLSCWRGGNYLGLGCAASSRVGNRRWTNAADFESYLTAGAREEEVLTPLIDGVERLIFGLRMAEGIDLEAILLACGLAGSPQEAAWKKTLARLEGEGLVVSGGGRWCLTTRGRELADHVAVELMP
jgi:oxygen-independent coproporphyrinogen-3 oxidase